MARKKENKRSDGYYEYKCIVDRKFDGTPVYKSFYSKKSKADARAKAEQYKINLVADKNQKEYIMFDEWAAIFLEHMKSKVKINTYRFGYDVIFNNHLIPYFKNTPLKSIVKNDIEDYVNLKLRDHQPSTVSTHVSKLSKCFNEAIDNGYIDYNPCRNITIKKQTKEKRVYTAEQAELVLKYCPLDKFGLPEHLLLSYGMSRSELLGIKLEDVDFENLTISINKGLTPRNKYTDGDILAETKNKYRNRLIAITQDTADFIKDRVQFGFVADPNRDRAPSAAGFKDKHLAFMSRMQKYYLDQGIEIPILNPHELRHTRASIWVNQGKNLFAIAEQMGWSDLSMLRKVYGHADIQKLRNELDL